MSQVGTGPARGQPQDRGTRVKDSVWNTTHLTCLTIFLQAVDLPHNETGDPLLLNETGPGDILIPEELWVWFGFILFFIYFYCFQRKWGERKKHP